MSALKKLDIGCGSSKRIGYIGVDRIAFDCVDVMHDLNTTPYPFEDNFADEIVLDNVLEHLDDPIAVIHELHRISKSNCKITIIVPYFRSFYSIIDPTHKNFFGYYYFFYFDKSHEFSQKYRYFNIFFNVLSVKFDTCFNGDQISLFHKALRKFANMYPVQYESKISHLFPLSSIEYVLEVQK
jgi:hypothetical protein